MLYAVATGISSGLMGHLARMPIKFTLPFYKPSSVIERMSNGAYKPTSTKIHLCFINFFWLLVSANKCDYS